jgi:hypothetical protein
LFFSFLFENNGSLRNALIEGEGSPERISVHPCFRKLGRRIEEEKEEAERVRSTKWEEEFFFRKKWSEKGALEKKGEMQNLTSQPPMRCG